MVPPDPVPVSLSDLSPDSLLRDVVSAYLEHYLVTRVLRKKMRESTRRHYARRLTPGHLRWLASLPISRIKHCTVLQWHEELEADSATSSLADNCAAVLRALFSWARRRGLIEHNPASAMRLEHRPEPKQPLTIVDLGRLWAEIDALELSRLQRWGDRARPVAIRSSTDCLRMIQLTGTRRSEMAFARREQLQLAARRMLFPDAKGHAGVVALGATGLDIMTRRLAETEGFSDFLFPSPTNPSKPINTCSVWDLCKQACGRLGLSRVSPHSLRVSMATWALEAGVSLETIMAQLRHRDQQVTRRHYVVYAVDPGARVLAERFDAVLRTVRAGRRGGDA